MARRKENAPMKFDLPDPFGPIRTLIGPRRKRSMRLMLLNPSMVTQSSVGIGGVSTL